MKRKQCISLMSGTTLIMWCLLVIQIIGCKDKDEVPEVTEKACNLTSMNINNTRNYTFHYDESEFTGSAILTRIEDSVNNEKFVFYYDTEYNGQPSDKLTKWTQNYLYNSQPKTKTATILYSTEHNSRIEWIIEVLDGTQIYRSLYKYDGSGKIDSIIRYNWQNVIDHRIDLTWNDNNLVRLEETGWMGHRIFENTSFTTVKSPFKGLPLHLIFISDIEYYSSNHPLTGSFNINNSGINQVVYETSIENGRVVKVSQRVSPNPMDAEIYFDYTCQ